MSSVNRHPRDVQLMIQGFTWLSLMLFVGLPVGWTVEAARSVLPIEKADAKTPDEMKEYIELIEHTDAKIEMVPIKGGEFLMGSPDDEEGRKDEEGPQHKVKVDPFWMAKYEMRWDVFEVWMFDLDIQRRKLLGGTETDRDKASLDYQISQPTEPYTDMTFGMGKRDYPAICMTQFGARTFCQWLTLKTGRYYRLPTEAEWEYACRAGTTTAYSFGDDAADLDDYGWYYDNSDDKYHKVGQKKANPWGLYDMHGNVAEWVLDEFVTDFYGQSAGKVADNPLAIPTKLFPHVVRGGSWQDDPEMCRSAARAGSTPNGRRRIRRSPRVFGTTPTRCMWVSASFGRLVEPSEQEKTDKWDKMSPFIDRKQGR